MTAMALPCRLLEWDSQFFGVRIARLEQSRLADAQWPAIAEWCKQNHVDCLYFLADAGDPVSARAAERAGFNLTDIRITFAHEAASQRGDALPVPGGVTFRAFKEDDLAALQSIARASYRDTRFYADGHFSEARCDALYETWIEKSCHGRDDLVIVAEVDTRPAGFITCSVRDGAGMIGLVGVSVEARGRGLGQLLVQASQQWFHSRGAGQALVVTQGRNIAAQRLYQRCGFLTHSVQIWYHRWFTHEHKHA